MTIVRHVLVGLISEFNFLLVTNAFAWMHFMMMEAKFCARNVTFHVPIVRIQPKNLAQSAMNKKIEKKIRKKYFRQLVNANLDFLSWLISNNASNSLVIKFARLATIINNLY